jgi:pSer/pThr/pTyr-binding forkhead associated (FHA) protein
MPDIPLNTQTIILGVVLFILLSIVAILLWVFVIRRLFKREKRAPAPETLPIHPAEKPQSPSPAPVDVPPPAAIAKTTEPSPTAPLDPQAPALHFTLESGQVKTFTSLPISIGRAVENNLILDDETVSANHASVYFDPRLKQICITDNDSLNGVFINDYPTHKNILRDGARVRIGDVSLTFHNSGYRHPDTD